MKNKILLLIPAVALLILATACGGSNAALGGHNTPTPTPTPGVNNVADLFVDGGTLFGQPVYANGVFTPVTICEPNTNNCVTLNDMLVDTGSYGVRVFATQITSLTLPMEASSAGHALAECAPFVDGLMWGPVELADVKIAGEQASNIPVHVAVESNDPSFPIPTACSDQGLTVFGAPDAGPHGFPAEGILGIGSFKEDCGGACALDITDSRNPGWYYDCPTSGCVQTSATAFEQVQNPVASFAADNNGVILSLPSVPGHDAPSVQGALIFGIGTQSNNGMGNAVVFPLDGNGNLVTVYNGSTQTAYVDSGSNALFFGTATGSLPDCKDTTPPGPPGFYCPTLGKSLTATIEGATPGSPTQPINFNILNAATLFSNQADFAFDNLGGPNPPIQGSGPVFDWGLPFFFGRDVIFSIDGQLTPQGNTAFLAF